MSASAKSHSGYACPRRLVPLVNAELKREVVSSCTSGSDPVDEDIGDELVPLCYFDRHISTWQEILHMMWATRVVDMSPGAGSLAWACVSMRIPVVLVAASARHSTLLEETLLQRIQEHMNDKSSDRFWKSNASLGLTEDVPEPPPKDPKPPVPDKTKMEPKTPAKEDSSDSDS